MQSIITVKQILFDIRNKNFPKKGVSVLVSAVAIIGITIAVAGLLIAWQGTTISAFLQSTSGNLGERLSCEKTNVILESVNYTCPTGAIKCIQGQSHTITASIRNIGTRAVNIEKLYIKNKTGSIFEWPVNKKIEVDEQYIYSNTTLLDTGSFGNLGTDNCTGLNQSVSQVIITTSCPNIDSRIPGESMIFVNC